MHRLREGAANGRFAQNANLVLQPERERRRPANEPTGEVESLVGKIDLSRMGDRAFRGRPEELQEKLQKARKRCVAGLGRAPGGG